MAKVASRSVFDPTDDADDDGVPDIIDPNVVKAKDVSKQVRGPMLPTPAQVPQKPLSEHPLETAIAAVEATDGGTDSDYRKAYTLQMLRQMLVSPSIPQHLYPDSTPAASSMDQAQDYFNPRSLHYNMPYVQDDINPNWGMPDPRAPSR